MECQIAKQLLACQLCLPNCTHEMSKAELIANSSKNLGFGMLGSQLPMMAKASCLMSVFFLTL